MRQPRPTRRQVLTWAGAGAAWVLVPGCGKGAPGSTPPPVVPSGPTYLTADERTMLAALADVIFPPDDGRPGGAALGTVTYVDRLLTAFDPANAAPTLFQAGPNTARSPVPDANGNPTAVQGDDDIAHLLPLDRVQTASWKLYLYGSDGVGGGPNDAVLGKVVGLRDAMRGNLADAQSKLTAPVGELNVAQKAAAFAALDPDFRSVLIELTLQAVFAAPEYGGNFNLGGWVLANFEGDVQPFGYTQWDEATQSMRERPLHPVSTANPGPDPEPLDDEVRELITTAVQLLGGRVF